MECSFNLRIMCIKRFPFTKHSVVRQRKVHLYTEYNHVPANNKNVEDSSCFPPKD